MAMVFIIFFFLHCDFRMSSWDYFIANEYVSGILVNTLYTRRYAHTHIVEHATSTTNIGMAEHKVSETQG